MNAGERYFDELSRVLERVRSTQAGAIEAAAAACAQAIVCRTVELCGGKAEVFCSANVDGGEEANAAYVAKYKKLVKPL